MNIMKTIITALLFLLFSVDMFSQDIVIPKDTTFVAKATENFYKMSFYQGTNTICVETSVRPDFPPNEFNWRYCCDVLDYGENPALILKRHLQSFVEKMEDIDDEIALNLYDLDGNLLYIRIFYPIRLFLPLTVVEEIEKDMRAHCKMKFTPITDEYSLERIHYAIFGISVPLNHILCLP